MFRPTTAFSSYSVDDVGKAKEFYGNKLGLEVRDDAMGGLELYVGQQHVFLYPKADHQPATFTVLNFAVDDIAAVHDELIQRGVSFGYPDDPDLGTDARGIFWGRDRAAGPNIAWFRDPAGNILSVVEGG